MRRNFKNLVGVVIMAIVLVQCAKRGNPNGGPVDELPPEIVRTYPENYSTNFNGEEIIIQFNEYIKFKDLNKQLVISPPLKSRPIILPQSGVAREIKIRITDTLKENTTYVLNFGQSVVDNNESNPFPYLKYVFSTGNYVDSLKLNGSVKNVVEYDTSDYVNILLFEMDSTYTDSAVFKKTPDYVLNTLDSLQTFTMENLRAGTYKMIALKEENSDYKFDPARDMIGFYPEPITIPSDETYEIKLYKQNANPSIKRATHESKYRIHLGYTGDLSKLQITPVDTGRILKSRITKLEAKDTLQYWFEPNKKLDSILLKAQFNDFTEEFKVKFKDLKPDSLVISKSGSFSLNGAMEFTATTPIEEVDVNKMQLMDKDSTVLSLSSRLDLFNNKAFLDFDKKENQKYDLEIYPGAVTDFFGAKNPDTLKWKYATKATRDYGNIIVTLTEAEKFPILLQIVSKELEVVEELIATKNGSFTFDILDPSNYYIRLVYDTNANGVWDPGNILKNIQPERIQYLRKSIQLKPNWDVNESLSPAKD